MTDSAWFANLSPPFVDRETIAKRTPKQIVISPDKGRPLSTGCKYTLNLADLAVGKGGVRMFDTEPEARAWLCEELEKDAKRHEAQAASLRATIAKWRHAPGDPHDTPPSEALDLLAVDVGGKVYEVRLCVGRTCLHHDDGPELWVRQHDADRGSYQYTHRYAWTLREADCDAFGLPTVLFTERDPEET